MLVYCFNLREPYWDMAKTSIEMVRQYSQIPITIILVDEPSAIFEDFCHKHKIEFLVKKQHPLDSKFPVNKIYLQEIVADNLLFLDVDTLIFKNIETIFNQYEALFTACENSWCYGQKYERSFLTRDMRPYNGGVMLFKNGIHRTIFKEFEATYNNTLNETTGLGGWLKSSGNAWTIDEFVISRVVANLGISQDYFQREHCHNIKWQQDFDTMKNSIVFHTYTHQWNEAVSRSKEVPSKKLPFRFFSRTP